MTIKELQMANSAWEPYSVVQVFSDRLDWRLLFEGAFWDMPESIKRLNVRTFSNEIIVTR